VAVRYPRGGDGEFYADVCLDPVLRSGEHITIVTYGTMVNTALQTANILLEKGIMAEVIKLGKIAPLDITDIAASAEKTGKVLVLEEVMDPGCIGNEVFAMLSERGISFRGYKKNLGTEFVQHGSASQLLTSLGLDSYSLSSYLTEVVGFEKS